MPDMIKRARLVYALLVVAWITVVAWQIAEHSRVKEAARTALINRSRDITTTLGLVIRSQRWRGGVVLQERLEPALQEFVKSGELRSVALLNAFGEVVLSAGLPLDWDARKMMQTAERWDARSVTIVNLVDLGAGLAPEGETNRPTIVLPPREPALGPGRDDRAPSPFGPRPGELGQPGPPPTEPGTTNLADRSRPPRRDGPERSRFGRPFWMDEKQFQALLEKRGLHGLVLALPTDTFRRACTQDLWIRLVIGALASIAVGGLALAWRNLAKSSELEVRLVRASELNARLKEMNLAAAGLAHETKNPLNIIRGLAQMISKQQDATPEVRGRSREIIDETDRVAAQLNEFINYSRPREVRRTAVALAAAVGEVVRAVGSDLEEKALRLQVAPDMPTIEADEQLLRQALFNLLINAIQAVPPQGEINIRAAKQSATEAYLEVCDNGPGVLPEHRTEIFKPYFTTQEKGTGLGLAVVQQIVLAHGWEIECLANEPQGAVFRITHLRLLP